jgi:two-component system, OmpR family, KDP operon response regulator KdpE
MSGPQILVVEDDAPTRHAVASTLAAHGFRVVEAGTVAEALAAWDAARPDLCIVDLGLPDRSGLSVIRRVRREAATPILVLSAAGEEATKVAALEQGADDYVVKPVGTAELRARIGALLRRAAGPAADPAGVASLGPITLDATRREVRVHGTLVDLTPREFELLRAFVRSPGRVVTRATLLRAVWGQAYAGEAHYLHVYVSRLRRKLDAADPAGAASGMIIAEPGIGYRVAGPDES